VTHVQITACEPALAGGHVGLSASSEIVGKYGHRSVTAAKSLRAFVNALDDLSAELQREQSPFALSSLPRWTPKPDRDARAEQVAAKAIDESPPHRDS
jgi:hypothetical protein